MHISMKIDTCGCSQSQQKSVSASSLTCSGKDVLNYSDSAGKYEIVSHCFMDKRNGIKVQ